MVRHIVAWELKAEQSPAEQAANAQKIKTELEKLPAIIPGILSLQVITKLLPSSTVSLMLDSTFESLEALEAYQIHPEHKRVSAFVATVRQSRQCMDYEF